MGNIYVHVYYTKYIYKQNIIGFHFFHVDFFCFCASLRMLCAPLSYPTVYLALGWLISLSSSITLSHPTALGLMHSRAGVTLCLGGKHTNRGKWTRRTLGHDINAQHTIKTQRERERRGAQPQARTHKTCTTAVARASSIISSNHKKRDKHDQRKPSTACFDFVFIIPHNLWALAFGHMDKERAREEK